MTLPDYLVAAMRANPADDGLRGQVADWFDENGNAKRAEFVRVGCEQARTPKTVPAGWWAIRRPAS